MDLPSGPLQKNLAHLKSKPKNEKSRKGEKKKKGLREKST